MQNIWCPLNCFLDLTCVEKSFIIPIMIRAHKIRLVPTVRQRIMLARTAGTTRYVYNWGLAEWNKQYEAHKADSTLARPNHLILSRQWTVERPEWSREVNRGSQTQSLKNLGTAFGNFFKGHAKHPVFKKKGGKQTFYVDNTKASIKGNHISLPKIGKVKMREPLRFEGVVRSYTVSHIAGQWSASVQVEMPEQVCTLNHSVVGVDVGINRIAVASDGSECLNPRALRKAQKKLRRKQRRLARQCKGSTRRKKTKLAISKTHLKISNVRSDIIHKFTSGLSKNHGKAVIETLSIEDMKGDKYMNRLLQDTAMREVHRQLEYKMETIKAPKYFPSSKRCSCCGHVKIVLPCSVRMYKCHKCNSLIDRDLNASYNLRNMPWVTGFMHGKGAPAPMHREVEPATCSHTI